MISDEERQRREFVISFSRGSVFFEGCILSPEIEEINQRYIDGKIDKAEHSNLCREQIYKESEKSKQ